MPAVAEQVRVPELRFPCFSESWREFYFGQLVTIQTGSRDTQDGQEAGKYPFYVRSSHVRRINSFSFRGEAILTSGDGVGVGKDYHFADGEYDVHQRVYVLNDFDRDTVPRFLFFWFSSRFYFRVRRLSAKNSVDSVRRSMISRMVCPLPPFEEQEKIAGFLTAVDERIGKLKRKKELLEEYKRGMMQKLFSQEFRFKDEHGRHYPDWEVRKLGELLLERVESGESESVMLSVTIKSGIRRFDELGRKDNSNPDKSKYKRLVAGDIAYNTLRLWQGASGLAQETGFVSPAYTVLRGDKSLVSMPFASYWMKLDSVIFLFQRNSQGLTSDQWTCKYPVFSRIKWPFPSLEEQERIAEFLTGLDEKLANLGQWIEKAEEFKRGLLQKMFV